MMYRGKNKSHSDRQPGGSSKSRADSQQNHIVFAKLSLPLVE